MFSTLVQFYPSWLKNRVIGDLMARFHLKITYEVINIKKKTKQTTANTKYSKLQQLYKVGITSSTLVKHCTNVIRMFCVSYEQIFSVTQIQNVVTAYLKRETLQPFGQTLLCKCERQYLCLLFNGLFCRQMSSPCLLIVNPNTYLTIRIP